MDDSSATDRSPWRVERVAETGSTNDDLAAAARRGEPSGAVLVTDHQTAGRGRLGRRWETPPGAALLVSVLLRPTPASASRLHGATQAVGLAARSACADVAGFTPELKWPNDLMVGSRKLAGVLAEAVEGAVVVGMGLNVSWPTEPTEQAVSLAAVLGRPVSRDDVLDCYLAHLAERVAQWNDGPDRLLDDYRAALATLGRAVRVELPQRVVEGTAVDLTAEGALVVEHQGERLEVSAADVVHLRGSVA